MKEIRALKQSLKWKWDFLAIKFPSSTLHPDQCFGIKQLSTYPTSAYWPVTKRKSNVQDICVPWFQLTPLQEMAQRAFFHRKASEFIWGTHGNHMLRSHVICPGKEMLIQNSQSVYPLFWTLGHINEIQLVQYFKMEMYRLLQNSPQAAWWQHSCRRQLFQVIWKEFILVRILSDF